MSSYQFRVSWDCLLLCLSPLILFITNPRIALWIFVCLYVCSFDFDQLYLPLTNLGLLSTRTPEHFQKSGCKPNFPPWAHLVFKPKSRSSYLSSFSFISPLFQCIGIILNPDSAILLLTTLSGFESFVIFPHLLSCTMKLKIANEGTKDRALWHTTRDFLQSWICTFESILGRWFPKHFSVLYM